MNSDQIREMFDDDGDMITTASIVSMIERDVWAIRRTCDWHGVVPQALERRTLLLIRSVLQNLQPTICSGVRGVKEQEILLAYWDRLELEKRKRLLEFLCELNRELMFLDPILS